MYTYIFFNDTATTEIYTLSLHDALPIFGAYRREILDSIGYFDEELVRNQDDELNYRVIKAGHKILLSPKIKSVYYSRGSLSRSEEHTSELQSRQYLVCRLLLEK